MERMFYRTIYSGNDYSKASVIYSRRLAMQLDQRKIKDEWCDDIYYVNGIAIVKKTDPNTGGDIHKVYMKGEKVCLPEDIKDFVQSQL